METPLANDWFEHSNLVCWSLYLRCGHVRYGQADRRCLWDRRGQCTIQLLTVARDVHNDMDT